MIPRDVEDYLLDEDAAKVGREDVVHVPMSKRHTVRRGDGSAGYDEAFFMGYGRLREGPHVEEEDYRWAGLELAHELGEDYGNVVAYFIEEDAKAGGVGDLLAAEGLRED